MATINERLAQLQEIKVLLQQRDLSSETIEKCELILASIEGEVERGAFEFETKLVELNALLRLTTNAVATYDPNFATFYDVGL
ncbi:hypothetical protein [Vibrio phage vB_VhaS-a]|nr:hypothetical protein [Vibrio phage vB_VhaS-a]